MNILYIIFYILYIWGGLSISYGDIICYKYTLERADCTQSQSHHDQHDLIQLVSMIYQRNLIQTLHIADGS